MVAGCATYDYEGSAHYRDVRKNTPVLLSVTDNLDRSSVWVRDKRDEVGPQIFDALSDDMAREASDYMREHGVSVAGSEVDARRRLTISIDAMRKYRLSQNTMVEAVATYSSASGETHTFPLDTIWIAESQPDLLTDVLMPLARRAVDEALLVWHPSELAMDVESPWGSFGPALYTLFPTSPIGGENIVPFDDSLVLTWEAITSERFLRGSGIVPSRISGVTYELQIGSAPYNGRGLYPVQPLEGPIALETTSYEVGNRVPWCGRIQWSFRARFLLDDHPRVTAWSPVSWTWVGAPNGIECYSVGLGVKAQLAASAATTDYKPFQLELLGAGDGVMSIMLSPSRCEIDDKACSERSRNNDNVVLHNLMQNHIGNLTPGLLVHNGAELVDPCWLGDDRKWYEMTTDDLSNWLSDESNRAGLLDAGIRRIVALHIGPWKMGNSAYDSDSELTMFADVFDVEDGQRLVRLQVERQGPLRDQSGSVLFFVLEGLDETELHGTASAFTKGMWRAAEIGVLAAVGAKIGWPESLVDSARD
jgi:hypothetical protein